MSSKTSLIVQFKLLSKLHFTMSKNEEDTWIKDSIALIGLNEITFKILNALFIILNQWKNQEGYLWNVEKDQSYIMSSYEALVFETIYGVNFKFKHEDENKWIAIEIVKNNIIKSLKDNDNV